MCMYVCVYVCICVYMYIYIYIYIYLGDNYTAGGGETQFLVMGAEEPNLRERTFGYSLQGGAVGGRCSGWG